MWFSTCFVVVMVVLFACIFGLYVCCHRNATKYATKYYVAAGERDVLAGEANKQAKYVRILKRSLCRMALRGGPRIVRYPG